MLIPEVFNIRNVASRAVLFELPLCLMYVSVFFKKRICSSPLTVNTCLKKKKNIFRIFVRVAFVFIIIIIIFGYPCT